MFPILLSFPFKDNNRKNKNREIKDNSFVIPSLPDKKTLLNTKIDCHRNQPIYKIKFINPKKMVSNSLQNSS